MFPSRNSLDRDSHRFLQLHHSALTSGSNGIGEALLSLCDARSVLYMIMSQDNFRAGYSHKGSSLQTLPVRLVLYKIWARMFPSRNSLDRDSHRFLQLHHSALTSGSDGIGEALLSLCDARSVLYLIM